ncbi:MAG: zinc ribbon domain-containing protein [Anaerolineales bacterium]
MMTTMRALIFRAMLVCLVIGALLFQTRVASAQNSLTLQTLEVDLWPEYDHPSVLVIYHITLAADVKLPADLKIHIPTSAGEPNAVAVKEADGALLKIAYTRTVMGDWSEITFTATMPQIQLEYYDPNLIKKGTQRSYTYQWPGDYAINELVIQVQQPIGASELTITPNMNKTTTGSDGLVYYSTEAGALDGGKSFNVTLEYQKQTNALSAESLQVQPSVPMGGITATRRTIMNYLPFILGALGLLLIFGAAFWWYYQSGLVKKSSKETHRRRKLVITAEEVIPEGYVYCHHCGKRALPGDRFCRACGTKLRI